MMKWFSCILVAISMLFQKVHASEPTVAPSNLKFTSITCSSATISWTTGNGSWNIVVVKEAAAVDAPPVDGAWYTPSSTFGTPPSSEISNGNFACYSSLASASSFNLTNLKMNTTYYVCVYAHDGAGPSAVDYLTSSAACGSFTTNNVQLDFSIAYSDTCQNTNKVKFINKSNVTIAGATYLWRFYNNPPSFDQSTNSDSVTYTWTKPGNKKVELYLIPIGGCNGIISKSLLIYSRAKPAPYVVGKDTQCYDHGNNHFYFDEKTTADPAPSIGLRRNWYLPTYTYTIPNPDVKNLLPGVYKIMYVGYTIYNNNPTGCYDTSYVTIKVIADPTSGVTINDTLQCLKGNKFDFDNVYPGLVSFSWDFGDGNTSSTKATSHSYATKGNYPVIHRAASAEGCKSADTNTVLVKPNTNATFNNLPPAVCEGSQPITLKPLRSGGKFIGQYLTDSIFDPQVPGTYPIKYFVPDSFCPDSTTQSITVNVLPRFNLGRDSNLCNGGSATLTIGATGSYLWDDGTTNQTRTTSSAGNYWGQATNNGCVWRDSINLFVGFSPKVSLPADTLLCRGAIFQLFANWPNSKIQWSTGSQDTMIYVTSPGTYTVTVTNPCGSATDNFTVNYQGEYCDVFIPDAFTPNRDGKNEVFQILGRGITPKMFIIYNRWGQIVFDSRESHTFGWDGTYNGQDCMDGMYSWLFYYEVAAGDFKRRNTIKGSVLLYH